ncbi:folylpolyglutamate synthase/dihydrofolate synthase family protein [Amycolatopsis sp., V23-08]|uniref:tetrahydrofolate synthase n=1 Tax=Amycolatopsis heterodermiae TaxID=3110235 RepID=A0ABU5R8P1_9PSEU|nr:folylpolyglutamate synthase/dihydrofolate synthase family protein [Amycolatopsis sp., V23-08]MEA5362602.1 folylpolyglutamate synthase/dihydrofolate synthase family protein [Amycolatopsis sp., V23-08]
MTSTARLPAVRYLLEELTPVKAFDGTGIERVRALLGRLGNPQDVPRTVHVAGTAGKGSVCAFLSAILTAHRFRVGAHLSPHVHSVLERFRIDGTTVTPEQFTAGVDRLRPAIAETESAGDGRPTFFEVTTALAFDLFAGRVDYSVIETGLGGLLDATNTITRPDKLAVLTSIGFDHTEVLGGTLPEIAAQKAGIFPHGGAAISVRNSPDVDAVLVRSAADRECLLDFVDGALDVRIPLGLAGRHQAVNALVAVRAAEFLARRDGWTVTAGAIARGLASARLPGRFERRTIGNHTVVLDGAHNPLKLAAVVATVRELFGSRPVPWVLAVKPDKDLAAVIRTIAPLAALVIATEFTSGGGDHPETRARSADEIASAARAAGVPATVERDPAAALCRAVTSAEDDVPIIVAGSFHLLAAIGPP